MRQLNIVGRLGADIEVKTIPSGKVVGMLRVAVDVGYGDRKQTDWYKALLWGARAEGGLVQYLTKGTQVAITGKLKMSQWTNNEGVPQTTPEIDIDDIDLVGGQQQQAQPSGTGGNQFAQPQAQQTQPAMNTPAGNNAYQQPKTGDAKQDFEDSIPFANPYKHREYLL